MNAERLLAHYERIADAPDAIPKLRRLVLDLAVRGKLVPQDPNDRPVACSLLRKELDRRQPTGRTGADLGPVTSAEMQVKLPPTWHWSRLFQLCVSDAPIVYGILQPGPNTRPDGVPYIRPSEIENGRIILSDIRYTTREIASQYSRASVKAGDLVLTIVGTIGAVAVVPGELDGGNITQSSCRLRTDARLVDWAFLVKALKSMCVIDQINRMRLGTAVPRLNIAHVRAIAVPLPPIAEQHRIVAKVDELMALCDRLEVARAEREKTRDRLTVASLACLNAPDPDPATLAGHARFALDNLAALTTRPDQIKQLRQTILNLAIRGKLVPQDPNDEPAGELLERIAADKARLVKTGEIAKQSETKPATRCELPFELPAHWQPARIEHVLNELQTGPFGSSLHQSDYRVGGTPVINPASIQNETLRPIDKMAVDSSTLERLASFRLRSGDVVMARRGEMGRCAIVNDQEAGWLCGTGSLILRPSKLIYAKFLVLLIGSPFGREYLGGSAVGTTMQNLNQSILLKLPLGLPPLAEQHRIVAKVDELMALCDRLETSLTATAATRRRLLDTLLAEALAPDEIKLELEAAE